MLQKERDLLTEELKRDEGLRLTVYDDATGKPIVKGSMVVGHPTIGIGRNLAGKGLTPSEVFYLLETDIEELLKQARTLEYWRGLTKVRQRVVLNMMFNLGFAGFQKFVRLDACLRTGDYEAAARCMEESVWYKQVGQRARRLVFMMRNDYCGGE